MLTSKLIYVNVNVRADLPCMYMYRYVNVVDYRSSQVRTCMRLEFVHCHKGPSWQYTPLGIATRLDLQSRPQAPIIQRQQRASVFKAPTALTSPVHQNSTSTFN